MPGVLLIALDASIMMGSVQILVLLLLSNNDDRAGQVERMMR